MYGISATEGCMHGHFKHSIEANSRTQINSIRALVKWYWLLTTNPAVHYHCHWATCDYSMQNVTHSQWSILTSKAEYEKRTKTTSLIFYGNYVLRQHFKNIKFKLSMWHTVFLVNSTSFKKKEFYSMYCSFSVITIISNKFTIMHKTV